MMNFLVIIFSVFLFSGINTINIDDAVGIDVLDMLKAKHQSCDLHAFVTSVDNSDKEYHALIHDLNKYCSPSQPIPLTRILCKAILIELDIGCSLPNKSWATPVKYTDAYTSSQICSMHKIVYTNRWIWQKFTTPEKQQLGSSWVRLCSKLTSSNSTLRLTRFFYKIAPRIRRAEGFNATLASNKTSKGLLANPSREEKQTILHHTNIQQGDQLVVKKTNENIYGHKKQVLLDLNVGQSQTIDNKKRRVRRNQFLDNDDDENIIDSDGGENELDVQRNPQQNEVQHEKVRSKRVDNAEVKVVNEVNDNEGLSLGRVGEKPEREQVNERPKPRNIDIESVFKPNEREKRNWIEGKQDDNQPPRVLRPNFNQFHRMKLEDNGLNIPPKRKKLSLRSRSNKYHDDDFDSWTNNFTTSLLVFILLLVVIYFILQNRNKVLGVIIEGCKRRRGIYGRRLGGSASLPRHTRLSQSI